jgi:hypothetical protein
MHMYIYMYIYIYLFQYTYIYIYRCIFRRPRSIAYLRPSAAADGGGAELACQREPAANSPRRVRREAVPTLTGVLRKHYCRGTPSRVLTGVLQGYCRGTAGVLQGYSTGTARSRAAGAGGRSDEGSTPTRCRRGTPSPRTRRAARACIPGACEGGSGTHRYIYICAHTCIYIRAYMCTHAQRTALRIYSL